MLISIEFQVFPVRSVSLPDGIASNIHEIKNILEYVHRIM
jgi:hypothetical protein